MLRSSIVAHRMTVEGRACRSRFHELMLICNQPPRRELSRGVIKHLHPQRENRFRNLRLRPRGWRTRRSAFELRNGRTLSVHDQARRPAPVRHQNKVLPPCFLTFAGGAADNTIWVRKSGTGVIVNVDVNGDARADFSFAVLGVAGLVSIAYRLESFSMPLS